MVTLLKEGEAGINTSTGSWLQRISTLPTHPMAPILRSLNPNGYVSLEELAEKAHMKPEDVLKKTLHLGGVFHVVQSEEGDVYIACPPLFGTGVVFPTIPNQE